MVMDQRSSITGFVHLHVHSYYSFLDSALSPGDVVQVAQAAGAEAVALTDINCLSGVIEFVKIAREAGIHAVVGAEVRQPFAWERKVLDNRSNVGGVAPPLVADAPDEDIVVPRALPGEEEFDRGTVSASPALCHGDPGQRVVLLARNFEGYSEISRICTRRMLNGDFDLYEELQCLSGNVIALSDSQPVLQGLVARRKCDVYGVIMPSRKRRRQNRVVFELCCDLELPLVVTCDVKLVAANDVKFHTLLQAMRRLITVEQVSPEDRIDPAQHFQEEAAIREFFQLDVDRGGALADPDVEKLRKAVASALENAARIAGLCDCRLPLGEWKFPRLEHSVGDPGEILRGHVYKGLGWRYGDPLPAEVIERAQYELGVIEKNHFTDYFLLVHRIVAEARKRNFYIVGRGSAANSIVSYALGITNVCPIKHDLYFERFLNPERSVPPDIDIDFSWKERDEILQWCFEYFGQNHVALISTIQTFRRRQAVRETAKALGISEGELTRFSRLAETGYRMEESVPAANGRGTRRKIYDLSKMEPWRTVLELSERLYGYPHHYSVHCGGIVITPSPVTDWVPLTRSAKGYAVTQYDMYSAEDLGLVKIDLLGNRSLGVLKDAINQAEKNRGKRGGRQARQDNGGGAEEGEAAGRQSINTQTFQREAVRMKMAGTRRGTTVALAGVLQNFAEAQGDTPQLISDDAPIEELAFDFARITSDAATRAMIDEGRTMGCFYIESPGMRALFERLRCKSYEEVVAASSIIRPGVAESGMMQEYITRHKADGDSRRSLVSVLPVMQEILPETHGVMVYQEDVLRVAHKVAGLTYGQADLLRRAMSGKHRSEEGIARLENDFINGALMNGIRAEGAGEIWRQIASFAGYSFCKGHSAAFAVLSYQIAWLKAHHPAEFFAGLLTNQGGFYGAGAYLQEARRWGVIVQGPSVNRSEHDYTGLSCEDDGGIRGWLRVGLLAVQNLSIRTLQRIVEERQRGGVFVSLSDFIRRTGAGLEECRTLIKAGALDEFMPGVSPAESRPALLLQARFEYGMERAVCPGGRRMGGAALAKPDDLFSAADNQGCIPVGQSVTTAFTLHELCAAEMESLGFYLSAHPVDLVKKPDNLVAARDIRQYNNRRVRMIGYGIAAKLLGTRNSGKLMKMLTLEDATDTFEAVLFPRVYERFAPRTLGTGPYLMEGKVDMSLGSPTLNVERVEVAEC